MEIFVKHLVRVDKVEPMADEDVCTYTNRKVPREGLSQELRLIDSSDCREIRKILGNRVTLEVLLLSAHRY